MNKPNAKRKIVCVLYEDPAEGYPPNYARDGIPTLADRMRPLSLRLGIETESREARSAVTPMFAFAVLTAA